jgi:glycosyltransferase involved in cell wall biosynthesis
MHYCFVTFGSWEGNAAHIRVVNIGNELLERGHRVSYLLDDVPFNHGDLQIHPKGELAFVKSPRTLWQIPNRRKVLKELRPDYVHLQQGHPKALAALAWRKQKVVGDWDEPRIMMDYGAVRNTAEAFFDRWLRKRANVKIACTAEAQKIFRERFGLELTYIPHAPYLPEHPPTTSPFTQPTAVYMGNFFPAWDHDIVLQAALILKQRGLAPPILIMGDGEDKPKWQKFVAENQLANVNLAGYVTGDELWRRLRHAHVLLFPIRNTIVNRTRCPSKTFAYAQASRPIITSRVGELPFMLGDEPSYIESTPEAFADTIADAMARKDLPDVKYHIEHHTWRERVDRLLKAIDGVAGNHAS